ncbi:MAG: FHA domain-containing protein [Pseudomonadota bacterium]
MKIRITPPNGPSRELELGPGTTTIGRGEECEVTLDERTVSRRHTDLYEDETGTLMVRDAGSRYGTRLNSRLVLDPSPFYHGDVLDVGGFMIEIPGSTVDAGPGTCEMETRRLKKDTRGAQPVVVMPSSGPSGAGRRNILSWLWVVLLLAGLILLGLLLVDYLDRGEGADGDAAHRPPAPASPARQAPPEDASWPSSVHRS